MFLRQKKKLVFVIILPYYYKQCKKSVLAKYEGYKNQQLDVKMLSKKVGHTMLLKTIKVCEFM